MLQKATITDAELSGCRLYGVDKFPFNYYEPKAGSAPYIPSIADAPWLKDLAYRKQVHGLVDLRDGFKKLGYREQERKITYAILHTQVWQLLDENKKTPVRAGKLSFKKIGGYINLILLEWTCKWGMNPMRPLLIMASLILPFSLFYMFALIFSEIKTQEDGTKTGDGIWKVWHQERANQIRGSEQNELLNCKKGFEIWGYGIYFSILSAFHVGWRDFNVGNWIARLQPREYRLQASGWIRFVSGLQSLISVYLLALTVLTYFGRPFESYALAPPSPMLSSLQQVKDFGTNPGNLKMFTYIPGKDRDKAPLVVALHGCPQNANKYANRTEWNELADRYKFYVVYPEQQLENNKNLCFNWFLSEDIKRDKGEALSIRQMIEHMISKYAIDRKKVYITGLSAGGYMTTVLLATYPEVFAGGAVMAGGPYRCATDKREVNVCMEGNINKSPDQWGDLVRNAHDEFSGFFPIISIFHGNADSIVQDINMSELVEQWTNVHQADQVPEVDEQVRGHAHKIYHDNNGKAIVETYHLQGMGHSISVDPGNGADQGGTKGINSEDKGIYSSFYAAKFWGLVP